MIDVLLKTVLKTVDFEKLQKDALNDPRVREALDLAMSIRDDFATIKSQNAEILRRLDILQATNEIQLAIPAAINEELND